MQRSAFFLLLICIVALCFSSVSVDAKKINRRAKLNNNRFYKRRMHRHSSPYDSANAATTAPTADLTGLTGLLSSAVPKSLPALPATPALPAAPALPAFKGGDDDEA